MSGGFAIPSGGRVAADVRLLRELASDGRLAATVSAAGAQEHATLASAAYEVAWPLVFDRITRPVERRRGHWRCSSAVHRMADDCLDRFHDDVEAVVMDLLSNAKVQINSLEAWVSRRLTAVTVDAHRRRRGRRGALQRPRMPGWLAAELGHDPWLLGLALDVLDWVGVPDTAGADLWPLDSWALRRATATGDWTGGTRAVITDVERVLAAMRRRPAWYADHVERPLGAKVAPVARPPGDAAGDTRPLSAATPQEVDDGRLHALAAAAVEAIATRLRRGEDPRQTVVRVLSAVFGSGTGREELDRMPAAGPALDERVSALLTNPEVLTRVVAEALAVIDAVPG